MIMSRMGLVRRALYRDVGKEAIGVKDRLVVIACFRITILTTFSFINNHLISVTYNNIIHHESCTNRYYWKTLL